MDIFENLDKNNFNLCKHVYELNTMLYEEKPFYYYRQTLSFAQIFEKYCLRKWKCAKGRIDLLSLLKDLNIDFILENTQPKDEIEALSCLQFDFNIIDYADKNQENLHADKKTYELVFNSVKNKIEYILSCTGYKFIKHRNFDYYIIVPRDEVVEIVSSTQEANYSFNLYEYTSPLNRHNIERKREIWRNLSNTAYTMASNYKKKYNNGLVHKISRDLSSILENFEIRHPNTDSRKSSDFKENLLNYSDDDWEEIYDTAFKLLLTIHMLDIYDEELSRVVKKHEDKINIL